VFKGTGCDVFCLETLWNCYLKPGAGNLQPAKQNHPTCKPFTNWKSRVNFIIMHKFPSFHNINSKGNGIVGEKLVRPTVPCRACFWPATRGKVVHSCIRLISNIIKPWNQGSEAGTIMQLLRLWSWAQHPDYDFIRSLYAKGDCNSFGIDKSSIVH